MTDRTYHRGLELTMLPDRARCEWPYCRITTDLGVGSPPTPYCSEHAQWVHAVAVEDALYEARGYVHPKHLVCDRCVKMHLVALNTVEADCGCVYSVAEQTTTKWCEEHGPYSGIAEAVSSS